MIFPEKDENEVHHYEREDLIDSWLGPALVSVVPVPTGMTLQEVLAAIQDLNRRSRWRGPLPRYIE
jgi:hypothetical protein